MQMTNEVTKDFLALKRIAVAGVSSSEKNAANLIYRTLRWGATDEELREKSSGDDSQIEHRNERSGKYDIVARFPQTQISS